MSNTFKTVILLGLLTALVLFVGNLLGGTSGLVFAFFFAIIMNFGSLFFSDKIALAMYRAKPAPENHELTKHVRHVAHLAGVPVPKAYILPTMSPNAFATGRSPKHSAIAASQGILDLLSKDELEGVIAHEMAHIKNRDTLIQTIAGTIAGVIGFVASMARWSAIFGGFGGDNDGPGIVELLVLAIVTPIAATLLQLALSRNREFIADATGAKITHKPLALAQALHKLENGVKAKPMNFGNKETASLFITNPFKADAFMKLLSTHPPTQERIKRLQNMV